MTTYLLLNAVLWGCAALVFVSVELGRSAIPMDWRDAAWLVMLAGMAVWPVFLMLK